MKRERFEKKLAKLGLEVQEGYNGKFYVEHKGNVASWRYENAWGEVDGRYQEIEGVQEARGFHIRREDDHTDLMTDYFAGYFLDNATQFCNALVPPPAKFPVGSLVRGKDNKRANRQGYAGLTGLLVEAGGDKYCRVNWIGREPSNYNSYPERDLELISAAA